MHMILLPSLLLLAPVPQDWSAYPLPSLSVPPAHAEGPELLRTGSHIALLPDHITGEPHLEAPLAPSLLTQIVSGYFSRSGLSLIPGSNPLLVLAPAQEHRELKAIFASLEDASQTLQIRLQVALLPGLPESLPAGIKQTGDSASNTPGTTYTGALRSGDSITFGSRTERSFIGGYEIDVATDSGVADPHRSSAASGETIHLTCARVLGGRAVHVEGVLDLAALGEITSFDPDTPELGEIEQPRVAICQVAFSGVATPDEPLRIVISGSEHFGDRTLFVSASTQEDQPAPAVGWAVRDLAFLASKGLKLSAPEPGLRPFSAAKAALPAGLTPTSPGSLVGLLTERSSLGADTARIHSAERLLLIPVTAPGALARAEALVSAMETPLLAQATCVLRHGETRVELCTTHGRLVRVLIGEEKPWLVDYQTEIAPNTWMPSPVTEVAFDGICLEGRANAGTLSARWWVSGTPAVHVATSSFANLGAIQQVERSYAAGNAHLERGSSRAISGLSAPLELGLE